MDEGFVRFMVAFCIIALVGNVIRHAKWKIYKARRKRKGKRVFRLRVKLAGI